MATLQQCNREYQLSHANDEMSRDSAENTSINSEHVLEGCSEKGQTYEALASQIQSLKLESAKNHQLLVGKRQRVAELSKLVEAQRAQIEENAASLELNQSAILSDRNSVDLLKTKLETISRKKTRFSSVLLNLDKRASLCDSDCDKLRHRAKAFSSVIAKATTEFENLSLKKSNRQYLFDAHCAQLVDKHSKLEEVLLKEETTLVNELAVLGGCLAEELKAVSAETVQRSADSAALGVASEQLSALKEEQSNLLRATETIAMRLADSNELLANLTNQCIAAGETMDSLRVERTEAEQQLAARLSELRMATGDAQKSEGEKRTKLGEAKVELENLRESLLRSCSLRDGRQADLLRCKAQIAELENQISELKTIKITKVEQKESATSKLNSLNDKVSSKLSDIVNKKSDVDIQQTTNSELKEKLNNTTLQVDAEKSVVAGLAAELQQMKSDELNRNEVLKTMEISLNDLEFSNAKLAEDSESMVIKLKEQQSLYQSELANDVAEEELEETKELQVVIGDLELTLDERRMEVDSLTAREKEVLAAAKHKDDAQMLLDDEIETILKNLGNSKAAFAKKKSFQDTHYRKYQVDNYEIIRWKKDEEEDCAAELRSLNSKIASLNCMKLDHDKLVAVVDAKKKEVVQKEMEVQDAGKSKSMDVDLNESDVIDKDCSMDMYESRISICSPRGNDFSGISPAAKRLLLSPLSPTQGNSSPVVCKVPNTAAVYEKRPEIPSSHGPKSAQAIVKGFSVQHATPLQTNRGLVNGTGGPEICKPPVSLPPSIIVNPSPHTPFNDGGLLTSTVRCPPKSGGLLSRIQKGSHAKKETTKKVKFDEPTPRSMNGLTRHEFFHQRFMAGFAKQDLQSPGLEMYDSDSDRNESKAMPAPKAPLTLPATVGVRGSLLEPAVKKSRKATASGSKSVAPKPSVLASRGATSGAKKSSRDQKNRANGGSNGSKNENDDEDIFELLDDPQFHLLIE